MKNYYSLVLKFVLIGYRMTNGVVSNTTRRKRTIILRKAIYFKDYLAFTIFPSVIEAFSESS
jgi:hypothetical protein